MNIYYYVKKRYAFTLFLSKQAVMMKEKIIYYKNELEDEFSTAQITPKIIDAGYKYEGGISFILGKLFFYQMIAKPLAFCFMKLKFRHRIVNKHLLKEAKKEGYFLYGNHTNDIADALIPSLTSFPKDVYVIVHPNNVSMPILGKITPFLGALPLPDDLKAAKNFNKSIEHKLKQKHCVTIYPEAHIWPYYTKIRPFKDTSFSYPLKLGSKVFCFTNTYQKCRFRKTPRIVTYVNGPFTTDSTLPMKEQRLQLRNQVYNAMCKAAQNNNVELIQYKKIED